MSQDYYKFIISPENVRGDLTTVNYRGTPVGVYSAMTKVVSSGPGGSSLLKQVSIPILLRQSAVDCGYYSPFDGAVLQKDVVANFLFSATTGSPMTYYVYNTSDQFQKFLELSAYRVDWGDNSPKQTITTYAPNSINHTYPAPPIGTSKQYKITLEQINPWGVTTVTKTITVPFKNVTIFNPQGECFFAPSFGNWIGTPVSYDYIFSGDAENNVQDQVSSDYITVPFTVSGVTKSRINELKPYGNLTLAQRINLPIINNGVLWGSITNAGSSFTAYTIQDTNYIDYNDGLTIFYQPSSGLTTENLTAVPITKNETLLKVIDQPQLSTNIYIERGKNSAYERVQRLGEVDNLGDMINYGYGFFNVVKKDT
jgi:hypothetical protein